MSDTSGRDRANGDDRNRSQRPGNAGNSSDRRPGQRSQQGGRYGTSRGGARDDRGGDRRDRGGYGRGRDNRRDDHRDDHRNNRRDDNRGSDRRDDRSGDRRDDRRGGYGRNGSGSSRSGSGGSGRSGDGRPAQRRDDSRSGYSRGGDSRGGRSGGRYDNRRDDNRRDNDRRDNDRRDNRGFDRDRGPDRRSDDRRGRDGGPRGDRPDRRRDDRPRHDRGGEGRFRDDHRDNRRRDDRQRDGGGRGGPRDRRDDRDARGDRGHGKSGQRAGAHGKPGRKPGSASGQRGDDRSVGRELLSAPELPEDAEYSMLDSEAKRELRSLPKDFAETIGRHLVAAGMLLDTEPEAALAHARYAKRRASRIPVVREAAGLAAYHTGNWSEALTELRAVRRMTHSDAHIAVIADSERAMGRPERALDIAKETNTAALPKEIAVELKIVEAGARRDLGQLDAAVVTLQGEDLDPDRPQPWSVRLFYAYADNLAAAGRTDEAVRWFLHAAEVDGDVETDAADRAAELAGE